MDPKLHFSAGLTGIWAEVPVGTLGSRYPGLGTLMTSNPDAQAIGSWARCPGFGTLSLGTLTTSNPDAQAIGGWARHLGLGTLPRYTDDEQS